MSASTISAKPTLPNATEVASFRLRKQLAHCLPNQNTKYIDYVIIYNKTNKNEERFKFEEEIRKEFFAELEREEFEIEFIEVTNRSQTQVYALLHCPVERLLHEAEKIRLEMRLNTAILHKVSRGDTR